MERILFPDAVAATMGALTAQLPGLGFSGVPVLTRVPAARPARFVVVLRTGGPRVNLVTDAAQITLEAWAPAEAEAHDLAQAVRGIVGGLAATVTGGVTVYGVEELSGPANSPDSVSDQARYAWSMIVNVRGIAA
jgi:hypothetical protein